jgi:hypothetical protein
MKEILARNGEIIGKGRLAAHGNGGFCLNSYSRKILPAPSTCAINLP